MDVIETIGAFETRSNDNMDFKQWHKWQSSLEGSTFLSATGTNENIICEGNIKDRGQGITNYHVPTNCGLGAISINNPSETNYSTRNFRIVCAACMPGFYPKRNLASSLVKEECTQIPNCLSNGNLFDGCEECDVGYLLKYENLRVVIDEATSDRKSVV